MPVRPGRSYDRGVRGLVQEDKITRMAGASWIEPQGAIVLFEDFTVDVLADSPYVSVSQQGTPTTAAAISASAGAPGSTALGGWVGGSTEAADAIQDQVAFGGLSTGSGTPWMRADRAGNGLLVAELGFVIPVALTARQYWFGLTDDPAETGTLNPALNIQTAYTLVDVADDAAGFVFSSLATAPTVWKYASTKAGTGSTVSSATEAATGIVDCYTVCRVEVDALGNAYYYQSVAGVATAGRKPPTFRGSKGLAVTATVGLLPTFAAAPTTTTAVEWELDYCFAAQAR